MLGTLRRRLTYANVAATVALFIAVGGGSALALSVVGSDGTVHGCYDNTTGALRVRDSASSCAANETALDWAQRGLN